MGMFATMWHEQGTIAFIYLDDICLIARTSQLCAKDAEILLRDLQD